MKKKVRKGIRKAIIKTTMETGYRPTPEEYREFERAAECLHRYLESIYKEIRKTPGIPLLTEEERKVFLERMGLTEEDVKEWRDKHERSTSM